MLTLLLAVLCGVVVVLKGVAVHGVSCDATKGDFMPNIGFFGMGYNVWKGNPQPFETAVDPGWTQQAIIDLSYTGDTKTPDNAYCIPDNTNAVRQEVCTFAQSESSIYGATSYGSALSEDASVGDEEDIGVEKFSINAEFKAKISESYSTSNRQVSVQNKAVCIAYAAGAEATNFQVSSDFASAVDALPSTFESNEDTWYDWIDTYGSHFSLTLHMLSFHTHNIFNNTVLMFNVRVMTH